MTPIQLFSDAFLWSLWTEWKFRWNNDLLKTEYCNSTVFNLNLSSLKLCPFSFVKFLFATVERLVFITLMPHLSVEEMEASWSCFFLHAKIFLKKNHSIFFFFSGIVKWSWTAYSFWGHLNGLFWKYVH